METYLKEIKHEADTGRVCDWPFIDVEGYPIRVYYRERKTGFIFYAIENVGHICVPETEHDEWHPKYTHVDCVYQGIACFDGVRHLYMGDEETDNYGYHYYPNIESNIETLKVIRELEIKYCRDRMKTIKNLPLKIVAAFLGTMFAAWLCFLIYRYGINVQKSSWEATMLVVSVLAAMWEFLLFLFIFGIDMI